MFSGFLQKVFSFSIFFEQVSIFFLVFLRLEFKEELKKRSYGFLSDGGEQFLPASLFIHENEVEYLFFVALKFSSSEAVEITSIPCSIASRKLQCPVSFCMWAHRSTGCVSNSLRVLNVSGQLILTEVAPFFLSLL